MVAYQDAALRHYDLGWRGVLPGFPGRNGGKAIPPPSTTGANGVDPDRDQVEEWVRTTPNAATLWRLPEGVVGLDVDHYDHKTGQTAREELERQYGQWAPTWCVTARATGDTLDTPSGIFLYRVPPGRYATSAGKDIDVIQRHHRFLTLPPTLHVRTGLPYRLFQPDGTQCKETPLFARLWATTPLAPEGLVAHLRV